MSYDLLSSLQETAKIIRSGGSPPGRIAFDAAGIARLREKLRLTQAEFGEKVGASERTVRSWESGTRNPGVMAKAMMSQLVQETASELETT